MKISFMDSMKWRRIMLLVVSKEFELVCIFWLFFSFHYHCQLVKGQFQQRSGVLPDSSPPSPAPLGFYGPVNKVLTYTEIKRT